MGFSPILWYIILVHEKRGTYSMQDALYLLDEAEQALEDISKLHHKALASEDLQRTLAFKIKNFLAALNSSLDYAAYYIFEVFCLENASAVYDNIEYIKRKIYFPAYKKEKIFEEQVNKHFVGLKEDHNFLYEVFKMPQEFEIGSSWLTDFKKHCNETKHVRLTRNKKLYSGTLDYLSFPEGITMLNNKFEGVGQVLTVNDVPFDPDNPHNHPYINQYEGEFTSYFSFEGSSKPIVKTLEFYLNMVMEIVTNINDYCESQQIKPSKES